MYALGYWSGLALCLTKVRSSRACCPATALILLPSYFIIIVFIMSDMLHARYDYCLFTSFSLPFISHSITSHLKLKTGWRKHAL